jgi:PKD repeat protein
MKRLLTLLFSLVVLGSFAQFPVMTASVSGYVTTQVTNMAIPGHMVKIAIYSFDSLSGGYLQNTVYTNDNGWYSFTGTIEGTEGYLEVQTEVCDNQLETQNFPISINANNVFTADFQICDNMGCQASFSYYETAPMTLQFINYSTQMEGMTYTWTFGDGTSSYELNPVKYYQTPGLYEVTLSISTADSSCYSSTMQYVDVMDTLYNKCMAYFYYTPDSAGALGYNFFDASTSMTEINNWTWDFGDNTTSNEQNPRHVYSEAGIYNICLTITSNDSLCYNVYCETIFAGQSDECIAQFTYYTPDPENPTVLQFVDLSYGADITSWTWSFGEGTASNEQNPIHDFGSTGVYTVCLTIGTPDCQSSWCEYVVIDVVNPDCANYFIYNTAGTSVQFSGSTLENTPAEFYWEFGDGTSAEGNPVTHTYQGQGIYYVTLMTMDATGCVAYSAQEVVVGDTMAFNQVYGQVFEGNFPLTSGFVMIFSEENDTTYYPYFDMIPVDQAGVFVFPMVPNGNFKVMAIPTDGSIYLPTYYESTIFWQDAANVTAGVTQNPVNIILQSMQGNTTTGPCVISGQINLGGVRDGFVGQIVVYLTDSDHNIIGFAQVAENGTFSFNNLAYGTYYIRPELSGVNSDYQMVNLTAQESEVSVVMTFTGNSILGKKEGIAMTADVMIYPNPANAESRVVFRQEKSGSVKVSFMDLSGRMLSEQVVTTNAGSGKADLDLHNIEPGIYILRLQFSDGSEVSKKLVRN